jgi:hypothetical protein
MTASHACNLLMVCSLLPVSSRTHHGMRPQFRSKQVAALNKSTSLSILIKTHSRVYSSLAYRLKSDRFNPLQDSLPPLSNQLLRIQLPHLSDKPANSLKVPNRHSIIRRNRNRNPMKSLSNNHKHPTRPRQKENAVGSLLRKKSTRKILKRKLRL